MRQGRPPTHFRGLLFPLFWGTPPTFSLVVMCVKGEGVALYCGVGGRGLPHHPCPLLPSDHCWIRCPPLPPHLNSILLLGGCPWEGGGLPVQSATNAMDGSDWQADGTDPRDLVPWGSSPLSAFEAVRVDLAFGVTSVNGPNEAGRAWGLASGTQQYQGLPWAPVLSALMLAILQEKGGQEHDSPNVLSGCHACLQRGPRFPRLQI